MLIWQMIDSVSLYEWLYFYIALLIDLGSWFATEKEIKHIVDFRALTTHVIP